VFAPHVDGQPGGGVPLFVFDDACVITSFRKMYVSVSTFVGR
jgi:hypothetical protein